MFMFPHDNDFPKIKKKIQLEHEKYILVFF